MNLSNGLFAILLLGATAAGAQQLPGHDDDASGDRLQLHHDEGYRDREDARRSGRHDFVAPAVQSAPEISPGTLIVALTLLGGGLVVLRGRRATPRADRL